MKPRLEVRFPLKDQWAFWTGNPYEPAQGEFLLDHARSGILLALQALALPAGSGVGVMAYNCHTVFNAVRQADYQPVFLDVTDALVLDKDDLVRKRGAIRALVVTHLFGILNDVDSIKENYPDLPVIEDCAHAFGLEQVSGDFAVFSIGQGKLPSLGDGGILFVKNRKYDETIARLYSDLPAYSWQGRLKQSLVMWIKSLSYIPFVYSSVTRFIKSRRNPFSGVEDVVPQLFDSGENPFIVVLDGVTDVRNFGAVARTCECAGVSAIVIPDRESVSANADAVKTSAGALNYLPVCREHNLAGAVRLLRDSGFKVVGTSDKSQMPYTRGDYTGPVAIVLGAEDKGISPEIMKLCDTQVMIPEFGHINSLNVSVAAGIMIYEVVRQRLNDNQEVN